MHKERRYKLVNVIKQHSVNKVIAQKFGDVCYNCFRKTARKSLRKSGTPTTTNEFIDTEATSSRCISLETLINPATMLT